MLCEQLAEYDDVRLKQCQSNEFSRQTSIAKHFAATKINLNGDKQPDLIVQAQKSGFMGAHNMTFWIFTEVEQRLSPEHDLVFSIAADFMEVLKTSTNGYRDIETASHTALELYTIIWKFDSSKYEARVCQIEDFRTKKVLAYRQPPKVNNFLSRQKMRNRMNRLSKKIFIVLLVFVCLSVNLVSIAQNAPKIDVADCQNDERVVDKCFWISGFIFISNGNPATRIRGNKPNRLFGIKDDENPILPENLSSILTLETKYDGNFLFCPFTKYKKKKMQMGCVAEAENLALKN